MSNLNRIVKTNAWMPNPTMVGQPALFAIVPTMLPNKWFIVLYVQGLNKISRRTVVYKVYRHLSADLVDIIYYRFIFFLIT